jgi:FkbM family methyltransferase
MIKYEDYIEVRDYDICGETNWIWIKHDQGAFLGPANDWVMSHRFIYEKYPKKLGTIVTAGTSCGMYARFYAKMFDYVFAFEPDPLSFHCMVNNVPYDNVIKINAALGHGNGIVGLNRIPLNQPSNDYMNIGMHQISNMNEFHVPMIAIDSLNLNELDVIQLDVEGFEQNAILGAVNTIIKFRPVIIAERFDSIENKNYMSSIGYKMVEKSSMDAVYIPVEN